MSEPKQLAAVIAEVFTICDRMRAAGQSRDEIHAYIEGVLRQVWPYQRAWIYGCDSCDDTGLILKTCTPAHRCHGISTRSDSPKDPPGRYRRLCAIEPTYTHTYGEPCHCARGDRFRPRARTVDSDLETAAATSRPMTRMGR